MIEQAPKILFQPQRHPNYQRFVDQGVATSLLESNLCWLACIEMALTYRGKTQSPIAASPELIDQILHEARVRKFINQTGALRSDYWTSLMSIINFTAPKFGLSSRFETLENASVLDFARVLDEGSLLIFNITRSNKEDHALIADEVVSADMGKNFIIRLWDPAKTSLEAPPVYFTGMGFERSLKEGSLGLKHPIIKIQS